jgi:hypothetical protein
MVGHRVFAGSVEGVDLVRRAIIKAAIVGAVFALLGIFPVAGLWALFWKIPVPFSGWASGWEGLVASPWVVIFLGIAMGGFPTLAICGAIGGGAIQSVSGKPNLRYVSILAMSLVLDVLLAALAVFCGPW